MFLLSPLIRKIVQNIYIINEQLKKYFSTYLVFYFPDVPIEQQTIPSQVFGSLKINNGDADAD